MTHHPSRKPNKPQKFVWPANRYRILNGTTKFYVAENWELQDPAFRINHVWLPARAFPHSRREWLMAMTIIYLYDGRLFWFDGRPYSIPDLDTLFDAPDMKWIERFLLISDDGVSPRHKTNRYDRLRVVELYCRLYAFEANQGDLPEVA